MILCNFSAYLHYESGIFNVNVYIDMKTEFKIVVYFIHFSFLEKEFIRMGQSCVQVRTFSVKFVFINPTF